METVQRRVVLVCISYFFSDVAIFIYVIQIKCPVEFFLNCSPEQNGKTLDEILKKDIKA